MAEPVFALSTSKAMLACSNWVLSLDTYVLFGYSLYDLFLDLVVF